MKIPFNNLKSNRRLKKKREWSKILTTIFAVFISLGIDTILPGVFFWLLSILSPIGFWQILVTIIVGFYALVIEGCILAVSTALLIAVLGEV